MIDEASAVAGSESNRVWDPRNPRGPVWFPVDVLLADKLRTYGRHFRPSFTIEIPTGSGQRKTLIEAADILDDGVTALFLTCSIRGCRRTRVRRGWG